MRIIRFVADDGRVLHGSERGDGSADVLIDAAGALGMRPAVNPGEFLRGKRAMVADDDENMRRLVSSVLGRFGCVCTMCPDGGSALAALESQPFDLVVSDIRMPDHNGYEVFAAARSRQPDLPIVLITGYGYDPSHSLIRAAQEGQQAVLYKPFTPQQLLEELSRAMYATDGAPGSGLVRTRETVRIDHLLAPLVPTDIVCVGRNYADNDAATRADDQDLEVFLKPTSSVLDPGQPIRMPAFDGVDPRLDCEGELAVVIGVHAQDVPEREALDHVLGYTVANDVTARYWQSIGGPPAWMRGKGFNTFCPLGPAVVTPDAMPDVCDLDVRTLVNGREVRTGNTRQMVRPVPSLISALSRHMTLTPGTVVLTGAPPAVPDGPTAAGLVPGDVVTIEIEGVGTLLNAVEDQ